MNIYKTAVLILWLLISGIGLGAGSSQLKTKLPINHQDDLIHSPNFAWHENKAKPVTLNRGSGGPDRYGYRWIDSNEPGGPVFSWVEIISNPQEGDDENWGWFTMPDTFIFYGNPFPNLRICSNGWISFSCDLNFYPPLLPDPMFPNTIAPFACDLAPLNPNYVYFGAVGNRFVVEWDSVYGYGGDGPYKFEIILNPVDSTILFQYLTSPNWAGNWATIGIGNADGSIGLGADQGYLTDHYAIKFYRPILAHDVGPIGFRMPGTIVDPMIPISPVVAVQNYGTNSATFNTTLTIDSAGVNIYSITQAVNNLPPGDTLRLTYPNWLPGSAGMVYDLTAFTTYALDMFPANDTIHTTTTVFIATWLLHSPYALRIPTIEGVIETIEWSDAIKLDVSDILGKGGGFPMPPGSVFLYAKNDSSSLYLAIDAVADSSTDDYDVFWQYYEDNNSHSYPYWPDNSEGELQFSWWTSGDSVKFMPIFIDNFSENYPAQLSRAASILSGNMQYEIVLPISGNAGLNEELQASVGDTVGLWFFVGDASTGTIYGWWPPEAAIGWGEPTDMGDVVLSNGTVVSEQQTRSVKSDAYSLSMIGPNPIKMTACFSYHLPGLCSVHLRVYDCSGKMVKNLVSKVQPHGEHLVRWNGTDDNGKSAAAGVYFCRLDAGDFNRTVKVILLK